MNTYWSTSIWSPNSLGSVNILIVNTLGCGESLVVVRGVIALSEGSLWKSEKGRIGTATRYEPALHVGY